MSDLIELTNLFIKYSKGQLDDLDTHFYKEEGVKGLHLEYCVTIDTESPSCTLVLIKLSRLSAEITEGAICFACWNSFSAYDLSTLLDDPAQGKVLSRLAKAYQLQERLSQWPLSSFDLENEGRGPEVISTLFVIEEDISSLDISTTLKLTLETAASELRFIVSELRKKIDESEAFLRNQFAWDLVALEKSKLADFLLETLEEAKINTPYSSGPDSFSELFLSQIALNSRSLTDTLQKLRLVIETFLDADRTELFMKVFTPKLENLLAEFTNTTGPNGLIQVATLRGVTWYDPALNGLLARYGFRTARGGLFMVIPAFAYNWLTRSRQGGFQATLLDMGESSAIIDTTIRLNEGAADGVYSFLSTAYKAAVNLV